jgi:hypothetical protein
MKDRLINLLEKWYLFVFLIAPYLYFSYSLLYQLLLPPSGINCGTGLFGGIILQGVMATILIIVLSLKMFFSKSYSIYEKVITYILIIVPFIATYYLFF